MTLYSVVLIELPSGVWQGRPSGRPFSALAADAMGCERRIRKGVNLARERLRYTQLCNWIEHSALTLLNQGGVRNTLVLSDSPGAPDASDYLWLVDYLQAQPDLVAWLNHPVPAGRRLSVWVRLWNLVRRVLNLGPKRAEFRARPNPVGPSFHPPGDAVLEQVRLYQRVTAERLLWAIEDEAAETLAAYADVAARKARFLSAAHARGSGVVEALDIAAG